MQLWVPFIQHGVPDSHLTLVFLKAHFRSVVSSWPRWFHSMLPHKKPKQPQFGHAVSCLTGLSALNKLEQDEWTLELVKFFFQLFSSHFSPHEAEQNNITALGGSPSAPPGAVVPKGTKKAEDKITPLPLLALLLLAAPTWKSTWSSLRVCRVETQTCIQGKNP